MNDVHPHYWIPAHDGESHAYAMFHRHYSSGKHRRPKIRQFVGPGEKLVLIGFFFPALIAWRRELYRLDGQEGVNCAIFRNESAYRSSELIREAMAYAWQRWPGERLYTFVNPRVIRSSNPGYCFQCAGWTRCGWTKSGLLILECMHLPPLREEKT